MISKPTVSDTELRERYLKLYSGAVNDIQDRMLNSKAMSLMFDKAQKVAPAEAKAE